MIETNRGAEHRRPGRTSVGEPILADCFSSIESSNPIAHPLTNHSVFEKRIESLQRIDLNHLESFCALFSAAAELSPSARPAQRVITPAETDRMITSFIRTARALDFDESHPAA